MIERSGIITHHAIYVTITVAVPCTPQQYETIYGPQNCEFEDQPEAHFTIHTLRVPCHKEQVSVQVHPKSGGHAMSGLRITGLVSLVEHQGHVHVASKMDQLGTTFVYLDDAGVSMEFADDWEPLQ